MGPGRNTVLGAVALTVVLGLAALVAVLTTGDDDAAPTSTTVTTAAGPNHTPVWDAPRDGSRFDVEPGRSASFTVAASDPDRDVVRLTMRFTDDQGNATARPDHVSCEPDADPGPAVRVTCRVAPDHDVIAFVQVQASDGRGGRTAPRRYLVSGSPQTYVALGDSYAAGEGVEPFVDDNRCHRSEHAYATQVRFPGDAEPVSERDDAAWAFWACSGAGTSDITTTSAGDDTAPELDHPDVGPGADVVTISIGGNDVGFAQVLNRCGAQPFSDHHCLDGTIDGRPFVEGLHARIDALRPKLVRVYRAVLERTFGARLLVVGYPQVFPATEAEQRCLGLRVFDFSPDEQDALRTLGTDLDAAIRSAAEEVGATYVDMTTVFAGHEVCGRAGEWINGVSGTLARWPPVDDESFHPKRVGQEAMAAAVTAAIAR